MQNTSSLLPVPQTHTHTHTRVHTGMHTHVLLALDPFCQRIQNSFSQAFVGLQSENQGDSTNDSISSDESFWSAAKSFWNGMEWNESTK